MLIRLLLIFMLGFNAYAQVGIGTTNPNATLDINGDLKIRGLPEEANPLNVKDSIMVINQGFVKSLPTNALLNAALATTVKGTFSNPGTIALTLVSGEAIIPFNNEAFDTNNEFDITTSTFTAKQDGIYRVDAQIKASGISVATNFGIAILKNGIVVSRNNFANVGILGINASPPIRKVETLLQLSAGDTIRFNVVASLTNLSLFQNSEDSYFSIYQIR